MTTAGRVTMQQALGLDAQSNVLRVSGHRRLRDISGDRSMKLRDLLDPRTDTSGENPAASPSHHQDESTSDNIKYFSEDEDEGYSIPTKRQRTQQQQDRSDTQVAAESADSSAESAERDGNGESGDSDSEAELIRELAKIKAERQAKEKKVESSGMNFSRSWDEDTVFRNQARTSSSSQPRRFVNDSVKSDSHKKFLNKYIS